MTVQIYKNNKKLIGSIIKLNRINQNISQKTLSKGICVPSYLSRIENGDLLPSEDVTSIILSKLGLTFNDSEEFIKQGKKDFKNFFGKLNLNEFEYTNSIFQKIEARENDFITSPLIIDYFLAKLARYSCGPEREKFENSKTVLFSAFDLLSPSQKFLYYYYAGIDILTSSTNQSSGKDFLQNALSYKETGHCYYWLSYAYRIENHPLKAYEAIKKALDLYLAEANILSIMNSYEKLSEVYFMLDNYTDAIHYLEMSLNVAIKMNNIYFIEHLNSSIAWAYYRLGEYDIALEYINSNTGVLDHRITIPDSITESLIYFSLKDTESLKASAFKIKALGSVKYIGEALADIIYKLFNFYNQNKDYMKSPIYEGLLIYIYDSTAKLPELKKVFTSLLKDYYIYNRKYKDALLLLDNSISTNS